MSLHWEHQKTYAFAALGPSANFWSNYKTELDKSPLQSHGPEFGHKGLGLFAGDGGVV